MSWERSTRRDALRAVGVMAGAGLAGCVGGSGGSASAESEDPTSLSVILNWKPNATQAGYFVADQNGFYEEEGLDVTLVSGQGGGFAAKQVGLGNQDLGLGTGVALLQARDKDLDVRSYANAQASNAAIYTVEEQFGGELTDPQQLAGKRVAAVAESAKTMTYLEMLLEQEGIRDEVELVNVGVEQQTSNLLSGNVDAAVGIFSDSVGLARQGYNASMLWLADYTPAIGRTVFTRPGYADENGDAIRGFLRATARGWAWASNNPEGAMDRMVDARSSLSQSREMGVLKLKYTAKNLVLSDTVREHGWGHQRADAWERVVSNLADSGVVDTGIPVADVWTNDYLDTEASVVGDYAAQVTTDYDLPV
ncbi:NitT/TauT family transport system substrate-binding protein [Haloplanus vescus]|uniref:Thiamine pyrimidine synthase n=1 Tax=Haloplanus vescus TaxID=555874 RepID=A0A1H3ZD54_9EURY|nr:ABC transporter substrate-binding protein [Haloplanus vescus]SEA21580.1 NitT/TauT family transport system substrate-binding protein [Haloplanus vescus]